MATQAPVDYLSETKRVQRDRDLNVHFVALNRAELESVSRMRYYNPFALMAHSSLMNIVFAGGLDVEKGSSGNDEHTSAHTPDPFAGGASRKRAAPESPADPDLWRGKSTDPANAVPRGWRVAGSLRETINTRWVSFIHDLHSHLFMFGFVIIRLHPVTRVPLALDPLLHSVEVLYRAGVTTYRVFDPTLNRKDLSNDPMQDVIVFETSPPHPSGRLRSVYAGLLKSVRQLDTLFEMNARAWDRGAAPTILTECVTPDTSDMERRRDIASHGDYTATSYTPAGLLREQQASEMNSATEYTRGLNSLGMRFTSIPGEAPNPSILRGASREDAARVVQLRPDTKVSATISPVMPPDIIEHSRHVGTLFASVYGVPPLWLDQASHAHVSSAVSDALRNAFRSTVHLITSVVDPLLQWVFEWENFVHSVSEASESTTVDESARNSNLHLTIPSVLNLTTAQALYTMGMLTHDQCATMVARHFGIPRSQLASEAIDPVSGRSMRDVIATETALASASASGGSSGGSSGPRTGASAVAKTRIAATIRAPTSNQGRYGDVEQ